MLEMTQQNISIFEVAFYTPIHIIHNQHEIILKRNSYSNKSELVTQICRINQFIYHWQEVYCTSHMFSHTS